MQSSGHIPAFVGRAAEIHLLASELSVVRAGASRTILVEGTAGIGKTALIDRLLSGESDLTVLRAKAAPNGSVRAFGIVDQLMDSTVVTRAELRADQQRSLPLEEPVRVGRRVLQAIEDLAAENVVVVVVDDAQLADLDSLRTLLFVTRRLFQARVLTLLVSREDGRLPHGRLPDGLNRQASGRTGRTLTLQSLSTAEVVQLAAASGVAALSWTAARQLREHTEGNPKHLTELLSEQPKDRWKSWEPVLPPPRSIAAETIRLIETSSPPLRRLLESAAVLEPEAMVSHLAVLAEVPDILPVLEEAVELRRLRVSGSGGGLGRVSFVSPLVRAAVYGHLPRLRRIGLHLEAAQLMVDEADSIRHRVRAAAPQDPVLAAEVARYARDRANRGAWAEAASALFAASRLCGDPDERQRLLLNAVDAMIGAGDLRQAEFFASEIVVQPDAVSQATLGYLAVLGGRPAEAEQRLFDAWQKADPVASPAAAAVVCQRLALHYVGRLRGDEVTRWSLRAIELSRRDDPIRVEAEALLGLGQSMHGDFSSGTVSYEAALKELSRLEPSPVDDRVKMAAGWLRLVDDDPVGARGILGPTAMSASTAGVPRIAAWSHIWLAHADFALGAWDDAVAQATRAVTLVEESGHSWLRPLARLAAVLVPAARGQWAVAEEHAESVTAAPGDYELVQVASGLALAYVSLARADHLGVLDALQPIRMLSSRGDVDEPGFWPWQDLYADALITAGRLDEAAEFLTEHETRSRERGRRSMNARLARVRGRLEAARGDLAAAEKAFQRGLAEITPLPLPFQRALLEVAYGQALRRAGQRRSAAQLLWSARDRFSQFQAHPYLERCDRELAACGLAPASRSDFDPSRLTAQESAVAQLVAMGMGNRQVANDLFISIKTVQFHLTRIYAKLSLNSRAELVAQFRDVADEDRAAGSTD